MKTIPASIILIFFSSFLIGQNPEKTPANQKRVNAVYVELLGNGGLMSINYDRILYSNENSHIFARLGTSEWHAEDSNESNWSIIPEIGFLLGKNRHFLDVGFGLTYWTGNQDLYFYPRFGYRYIGKRGLVIRLAVLSFVINHEPDSFGGYWPGLAVGYGF